MPTATTIQPATMAPAPEEPIDYARLLAVGAWALARYDLAEWELRIALKIIYYSFGQRRPFFPLPKKTVLAQLVGMSPSNLGTGLKRLVRTKIVHETQVGGWWILTFMPPSKEWPWLGVESRLVSAQAEWEADENERWLLHAGRVWPEQGELFAPEPEREFEDALALERMRASILTAHRRAAAHGAGSERTDFPVTDRLPTPAPAEQASSSGEGPTRPLESWEGDESSSHDLSEQRKPTQAENSVKDQSPEAAPAGHGSSSAPEQKRPPANLREQVAASLGISVAEAEEAMLENNIAGENPMLENNIDVGKQHLPLRGDSKSEAKLHSKSMLLEGDVGKQHRSRPNLGILDPGAGEAEIMAWLVQALGEPIMEKWGADWRLDIRFNRRAVIDACYELRLRVQDTILKPLANRGGWLRDKHKTILKERTGHRVRPGKREIP